jgi:protein phosphatase
MPAAVEQPTLDLGAPARTFHVEAFGLTDPGRVRPTNEDQFVVAELSKALRVRQSSLPQPADQLRDTRGHLFIVADGMGGHAGGQEASRIVADSIEDFVLRALKWFSSPRGEEGKELVAELQAAVHRADARLAAEAAAHPELQGMGSTLTLAYYLDGELFVAHAGDSRAYLLRDGRLHRLTHDHTLTAELVRRGAISQEEATTHRLRHVVTNVVGGGTAGVRVELVKLHVESGDRILLCTDGLTDMLGEADIGTALGGHDVRTCCERLVGAANERGGRDNVTAVVVGFTDA